MAGEEVRNLTEGSLYIVQASGLGTSWVTASAASALLIGYCQTTTYDSARTIVPIMDRGLPKHFKETERGPISVGLSFFEALTAQNPAFLGTGNQTTVKLWNVEIRSRAQEVGSGSALYQQIYGVAFTNVSWSTQNPANTVTLQGQALAMGPVTGSGYCA